MSEPQLDPTITEKVIDIVVDHLDVSRDQVSAKTHLVNDLGADSLDTAELVMEIEDVFDLNIPEDEQGIQTVADAVTYIMEHGQKS